MKTAFPDNLRAARIRAGYSQTDVAHQIPCAVMKVSQWETGLRPINHNDLIRVCQILDVSADDLLGLRKE